MLISRTARYIGLLFLLLSPAITVWAGGSISGRITGLPQGRLELVLQEDINRKRTKSVAYITVGPSGAFSFVHKLPPHIYELRSKDQKLVTLAVGTGQKIVITGDISDPGRLQVAGSDDTAVLEAYERFRKESLDRLVISVRTQIKKLKADGVTENDPALLKLAQLEIDNYELHRNELIKYVREKMGTSLAIYPTSIRWNGDDNLPFLTELARRFERAHPGSAIAARVNEKVKTLTANSSGGRVREIRMPNKDGAMMPLFSNKAKYTLIDFWASWCPPCRGESGQLGELYQRFQPHGFEIYGVGLESERGAWLKAIEQDKRVWTNVSTLQEFQTPAAFDYAVTSLPANVLIDDAGKVIARNLHGDELKTTLEKLFAPVSARNH